MGSVGDAYDNAVAESFFATLETELIDRSAWRTRADARLALFDYIETFYNPQRRHSFIGQLSPAEFERRYGSEPAARKRGNSTSEVTACPACGTELATGAKFCAECGSRLPSAAAPTGESRRVVSILFSDVSGSTALGELAAEEILNVAQARCLQYGSARKAASC